MHIADGFLSPPVWATLDVLSVPAVVWVARRAQREPAQAPLLGTMGAFVFAAQMVNFPVGLGTSGHLVGGALLAAILGPGSATLVMTAIVILQALVFQDGGVLVLGANIFNMALMGVAAGYLPYRLWGARWRSAALFAGGALSVMTSAGLAISELLFSGVHLPPATWGIAAGVFFASAVIEGAITVAAAQAIERLRPQALRDPGPAPSRLLAATACAAVLLVIAGVVAASAAPDGLAQVAHQIGLPDSSSWRAPLAGYRASVLPTEWLDQAAAGLCGLILIYGLCLGAGRFPSRRS